MSLNSLFSSMKREGYVIKPLEMYLLSLSAKDSDRAVNVNAPSSVGQCLRARYYTRTGAPCDPYSVDARTRRIFDNGTYVHERLQKYLKEAGILLVDEAPVINDEYCIQGHTDGILKLSDKELGILEIKSINSRNFSELKSEKPEHKRQGLIYAYCIEQRRKYLKEKYLTEEEFSKSKLARTIYYRKKYSYLQDGRHYSREEKIKFQVKLAMCCDSLLYHCDMPVTKVIFLYENKDTQDLKEYCVSSTSADTKTTLDTMFTEFEELNNDIPNGVVPSRAGTNKSCQTCRWCNYKTECWN